MKNDLQKSKLYALKSQSITIHTHGDHKKIFISTCILLSLIFIKEKEYNESFKIMDMVMDNHILISEEYEIRIYICLLHMISLLLTYNEELRARNYCKYAIRIGKNIMKYTVVKRTYSRLYTI
jgi:hypothetical protein